MTCVYDVLLNFNDLDLFDFFEWQEKDVIEHVKKIYLIRVSTKMMDDIIKYQIKVSLDFLEKINNKTILYKNKKCIKYAALFTDFNKVIALEFDNNGNVIARSTLMLDEEEDIIEEFENLEEEVIEYEKKNKYKKKIFLTRNERFKRNYLLKEINFAYKGKKFDKLSYFYEEIYEKNDLISIDDKYKILIKDLIENYSDVHNKLYEIVRLTYTKK